MAVTTTIRPSYGWRMLAMGVVCVGFGLWGAYDLWIKIPSKERNHRDYLTAQSVIADVEEEAAELQKHGAALPSDQQQRWDDAKTKLSEVAPGGKVPVPPGTMDKPTQWLFISSILFAPYFFIEYARTRRRVYRLDDDGTLHLPATPQAAGGQAWTSGDLADIDMSRWMSKSIATVVHRDGHRVALDDYKHRNLHLIVGAIAARLHPDQWTAEAKPVRKDEEDDSGDGNDADSDSAAPLAATATGETDRS